MSVPEVSPEADHHPTDVVHDSPSTTAPGRLRSESTSCPGETAPLGRHVVFSAPAESSALRPRREDAPIVVAPPLDYRATRGLSFMLYEQSPQLLEGLGHAARNHRGVRPTEQDRSSLDHDPTKFSARQNFATHCTGRFSLPSSHALQESRGSRPRTTFLQTLMRAVRLALLQPTRSPSRRASYR